MLTPDIPDKELHELLSYSPVNDSSHHRNLTESHSTVAKSSIHVAKAALIRKSYMKGNEIKSDE